ncbi:pyridoxal-phosphate dependent enzyme [Modestobacter sp. NPDC049651]|uniref:pyridoxal-phosphate dependent enzyme n=1 Tax=unclassified Modestobacter TaxID=2643866 RepID=UPI0033E59386
MRTLGNKASCGLALGLWPDDLVVKRDDLTDLGGGNKVRKLEHLLAEARAAGATALVTTGGLQSNHARITALAAAPLGLRAVLVLTGTGDPARTGNLALEELAGARIVPLPAGADAAERLAAEADALRAAGERPFVVPLGGSTPTGARGYLTCAAELAEQVPDLATVVVALGSGGTMAGLVAGLGAGRVLGVDVGAVPDPAGRVRDVVTALGAPVPELRLRTDQVGEGYGVATAAGVRALRTAAATEGLLLDPVYTGKALAGLAVAVADGSIRPGERMVLLHTGGLVGLFGHPLAAEPTAAALAGDGGAVPGELVR